MPLIPFGTGTGLEGGVVASEVSQAHTHCAQVTHACVVV